MTIIPIILASFAAAQSLPDAPTPAQPAQPMTIEQAVRDLKEHPIPSFAEWKKQREKDALQPRKDERSAPRAGGGFGTLLNANDPDRIIGAKRFDTEQLALDLAHPAPGVAVGAFYANHDQYYEHWRQVHDVQRGFRLTFQISGERKRRPVFSFPLDGDFTETEVGRKVIVHEDHFVTSPDEVRRRLPKNVKTP